MLAPGRQLLQLDSLSGNPFYLVIWILFNQWNLGHSQLICRYFFGNLFLVFYQLFNHKFIHSNSQEISTFWICILFTWHNGQTKGGRKSNDLSLESRTKMIPLHWKQTLHSYFVIWYYPAKNSKRTVLIYVIILKAEIGSIWMTLPSTNAQFRLVSKEKEFLMENPKPPLLDYSNLHSALGLKPPWFHQYFSYLTDYYD